MRRSLPFALRRPSNETLAAAISFFTALYFYLPLMTIYLFHKGLDLTQVSLMSSIIVAAQFAAEAPSGILADRWGRKRAWVLAVGLQLAGEVWFLFANAFWEYAAISVLAGLGFASASGAVEALIYDTLPPDDRPARMQKAMGKMSAAQFGGNLLAYLACGVILAQPTLARFQLAIALTAAAVAVGWVITWFVFDPQASHAAGARGGSALEIIKSGAALLRGRPALRRAVLLAVLSNPFAFYLINFFQPYFAAAGVPEAWYGPLVAGGSLLAMFFSRYAHLLESRLGLRRGLLLATAAPGLVYLLMTLADGRALLAAGLVLLQFGVVAAARPLLSAYINEHIESESRATVLSLAQLIGSVYLALAGPLLGWLGGRSLAGMFALMGCVVLAAALALRAADRPPRAAAQAQS